jgi:ribosomal protein L25 (general stress protein Ctc)
VFFFFNYFRYIFCRRNDLNYKINDEKIVNKVEANKKNNIIKLDIKFLKQLAVIRSLNLYSF